MTDHHVELGATPDDAAPPSLISTIEKLWHRSSVSAPMSRLEFELLAEPYARGYESALAGFRSETVNVSVRLHHGHLYSTVEQGCGELCANRHRPALPIEPTEREWVENIRPTLKSHFREFADLADAAPPVAVRRAAALFEQCISLHHQLLLPARRVVSDFLDICTLQPENHGTKDLPFAILTLLGVDLPAFRGAKTVLSASSELSPLEIFERFSDVAPDGDGYGLAIGGWLDSARYANVTRAFLSRADVSDATVARRMRLRVRRRHLAEQILLSTCLPSRRSTLESRMHEARVALNLTECHGPLMHSCYLHHLRRLLLSLGAKLLLPKASDIVHLAISELDLDRMPNHHEITTRRERYETERTTLLPPPTLKSNATGRLTLGNSRSIPETPQIEVHTHTWRGVPGSLGRAAGRLVVAQRPGELARVMPGDVVLVPDPGAAWGWLGLGVRALLVEGGDQLSHVATAAREIGIPCVLDCGELAAVVGEGQTVQVDGRRGLVRW